jgi:hypothetical protein
VTRYATLERIRLDGGLPDLKAAIRASLQGDFADLLQCGHPAHAAPSRRRDRLTEPEMVRRVQDESGLADMGAARRLIRVVLGAFSLRFGDEEREGAANVALGLGSLGRSRRDEGDDE